MRTVTNTNPDHFDTEPVMPSDPEELFDVVDTANRVVRQAPRSEVHANGWLHRSAQMWVFRSDGRLLVHRRAAGKDEDPLKWSSSAAGHVGAGETYAESARRELLEELGLDCELEYLTEFVATPETANEFVAFYRTVSDATPTPDPEEIAEWTAKTLDELQHEVATAPDRFTMIFRRCLAWYGERVGRA